MKEMIFRTASSKPGRERSACRAARSAGCSHETPEMPGKATRGRGAGMVVIVTAPVRGRRPYGRSDLGVSSCDGTTVRGYDGTTGRRDDGTTVRGSLSD